MKLLVIIFMVSLASCVRYCAEDSVQDERYVDAIKVVEELIYMPAPIVQMYEDGEECIFTSPPVEEVIRNYAQFNQGGTDRCAIARALDDLSFAISIISDIDKDGTLTDVEVRNFAAHTLESNGIDVLFCLTVAYEDTPRRR